MPKPMTKQWVLSAMALAALAVPGLISSVSAQGAGPGQPPPPQARPGEPPQGPRGMGGGMMPMGQATMIDDQSFIYILRGHQLVKVQKSDLRVVGQVMLPMPEMPGGGGGFGGGGFRGGGGFGGGGGGGRVPPPPEK